MMRHPLVRAGHHVTLVVGLLSSAVLIIGIIVVVAYQLAYGKMILPRVMVSGIEVSNMDRETAKKRLVVEFASNPNLVQVYYRDQVLSETAGLAKSYNFDWAVEQALSLGRGGNILTKISERADMFFRPRTIGLPISYDNDALDGMISRVAAKVNQGAVLAKLKISDIGEVRIEPGVDGLEVDEERLRRMIVTNLVLPGSHKVETPTRVESAAIDDARIDEVLAVANKWKGKNLRIFRNDFNLFLRTDDVFKLIGLSKEAVNIAEIDRLLAEVKSRVEVEAKNAVFNFDQDKVIEFSPEVSGIKVDDVKFREKLAQVVLGVQTTEVEVPVIVTEPKVKAGEINSLGIKTLVGVGTSKFAHSIPNRVHNLTLASSRLNGALVAPGETFSLGQTVGEISRTTGYREAYVISEGRTVLGDGGGVCQVSTTLFRAVLNAGLPVVERKAHAYRVGYYEQDMGPGYDATVFFPSTDFRFINDTPGYLLIQTKVDANNFSMRYEIYGTDDGRESVISPAKIFAQTPPKPTVYQDDPTLPLGMKKQIDWSAWGARVSFDYKVTRNGEVLQDRTFSSTYQPWAAVYLVGTGRLAASN